MILDGCFMNDQGVYYGIFTVNFDAWEENNKLEKNYWFKIDEIYGKPDKTEMPGKYKTPVADSVSDKIFQQKIFNVLNRKHPHANFKRLIDDSGCRQDWIAGR